MKEKSWIIPAVLLAIVCVIFGVIYNASQNKNKALEEKNAKLTEEYNNATQTLTEFETNLDALDRDLLGQISSTNGVEGLSPQDRRTRLMNNIANMRTQIEADKARIRELESQLASSRTQLRGVQSMINQLRASVADKEGILAELQGRLNTLNQTLESERRTSAETIQNRDRTIAERQAQLDEQTARENTMYYIAGSRDALIQKGIIDRRGGLLGIGRVSTVNSSYDASNFTMFNLADTQTITFPATRKGYSILSDQSASSYRIDRNGENYVLTVTDPQSFRRHKYVVIEIK